MLSTFTVGHGLGSRVTSDMCFDRKAKVSILYGRHLPHWHQPGKLSFITWRLADSLPQVILNELRSIKTEWLARHPTPWNKETAELYTLAIGSHIDKWLDSNYGNCILADPAYRAIVEDALRHNDGVRYDLYDFVIMPNHIHFIARFFDEAPSEVIPAIKSYTANRIHKAGYQGQNVWQSDFFDRLIRSIDDYREKADYIRCNPDALRHVL